MNRFVLAGALALTLLGATTPGRAQEIKQGDCNEDGEVVINELIVLVNILLGSAPVEDCVPGDLNGNGSIEVNEIVAAVGCANGTCPPRNGGDGACGDGTLDTADGEECDDGNNFGGDLCAGNCTNEVPVVGVFDSSQTIATVQTEGFPVVINLVGQQTFRFGKTRPTETTNPDGDVIFKANELPVVIRASELLFAPVRVTGLVCACVRGIPAESFGPGNCGTGSVGCADGVLSDVNYRLIQDHNTTPGSDGNRLSVETGTPDDPECDAVTMLPGNTSSAACVEGDPDVESCANDPGEEETHPHIGVCNGPRQFTRSGGPAPDGSAFILFNIAIGLLQDRGICRPACDSDSDCRPPANGICVAGSCRLPNGSCEFADYGPDCLPCTEDDLEMGTPQNIPLTTGAMEAAVIDANNSESVENVPGGSVRIEKDADCLGPCKTEANGSLFSCDDILAGSLAGGSLAVGFPAVDSATIGDNVTTTTFFNQ